MMRCELLNIRTIHSMADSLSRSIGSIPIGSINFLAFLGFGRYVRRDHMQFYTGRCSAIQLLFKWCDVDIVTLLAQLLGDWLEKSDDTFKGFGMSHGKLELYRAYMHHRFAECWWYAICSWIERLRS